jgi:hypothetical protein
MIMSRIVIVIFIYRRHKPIDLLNNKVNAGDKSANLSEDVK